MFTILPSITIGHIRDTVTLPSTKLPFKCRIKSYKNDNCKKVISRDKGIVRNKLFTKVHIQEEEDRTFQQEVKLKAKQYRLPGSYS